MTISGARHCPLCGGRMAPPLPKLSAELLPTRIADLHISGRAKFALHELGIRTVADAADPARLSRSMLLRHPNIGRVTTDQIEAALREFGVVLPQWEGPAA